MAAIRSSRIKRSVSSQRAQRIHTRHHATNMSPFTNTVTTTTRPKEFSGLPAELRLKIWHSAVIPRMVWFPRMDPPSTFEENLRMWAYEITRTGKKDLLPPGSNKTPLALLGACKESREEIKPLYREMFGFTNTANDEQSNLEFQFRSREYKEIVFNPDVDILMCDLGTAQDVVDFGTIDFQKLRYVAIPVDDEILFKSNRFTHIKSSFPTQLVDLFLKCPSLQRLYFYLDPDPEEYRRMAKEEYKEYLNYSLKDYIHMHILLSREYEEGSKAAQDLVQRWMEAAEVKFLSEVKEELGAASTECIF